MINSKQVALTVALALLVAGAGSHAQEPATAAATPAAEQASATPRGTTFLLPVGWAKRVQGTAVFVSPPEADGSRIVIVDTVADSPDAAVAEAWALLGMTPKLVVATDSAPRDGWEQRRFYEYDVAANWNLGALQLGAGYEKNGSAKQFGVRALYEMGPFVFGAYFQDDTDGFGAGLGSRKNYRVSGAYNVGASEFHINYGMADDYSKRANSSASQFTLGYNYNLSKRTKVYAFYSAVDNGSAFSYFGKTNTRGQVLDTTVLAAGVRHNF